MMTCLRETSVRCVSRTPNEIRVFAIPCIVLRYGSPRILVCIFMCLYEKRGRFRFRYLECLRASLCGHKHSAWSDRYNILHTQGKLVNNSLIAFAIRCGMLRYIVNAQYIGVDISVMAYPFSSGLSTRVLQ